MIELINDDEFVSRIVSAVNVESEDAYEEEFAGPMARLPDENRAVAGVKSKDRGPVITKEILARRWGIGLDTAHRTLVATTQFGVRRILHPVADDSGLDKRICASLT
jgi:hypothetical protein